MITLLLSLTKEIVEIPNKGDFKDGDMVVVNDDGSQELAQVLSVDEREKGAVVSERKVEILREAKEEDLKKVEEGQKEARKLMKKVQEVADDLKLPMFVWDAAFSFDERKVTFFFQAGERVDFRELVKRLSVDLGKRVHLQQVGPRDRAKMRGGMGTCGKKLCCASWLRSFPSITMETARAQGLGYKSPSKISGQCGRLLCCLQFEVENYKELSKNFPALGEIVKFAEGEKKGKVLSNDVINGRVKVMVDDGKRGFVVAVPLDEIEGKFRKMKG